MRQVIILSGVSGSGKSTYAQRLVQLQGIRISTDDYFMKDGVYTFDPSKLEAAHNACFRTVIGYLEAGYPDIVVDNTNTTVWEISPYVLAAGAFGYQAEVRTLWVQARDLSKAYERAIHSVPFGAITNQSYNLARRVLPKHWHNVEIDVTF